MLLHTQSIPKWKVWVDPGLGFAKKKDQNLALIRQVQSFKRLGYPIVIGFSNKRFVETYFKDRKVGNAALTMSCIEKGVQMIRFHDPYVLPCIQTANELYRTYTDQS